VHEHDRAEHLDCERQCHQRRVDPEHERDAAKRFERHHGVSQHGGQAQPREVVDEPRRREDEDLQRHVGQEQHAQRHAQQQHGVRCGIGLDHVCLPPGESVRLAPDPAGFCAGPAGGM
jgi:hypothetical protein